MEDPSRKEEPARVLNVLEALKQASHELQAHPGSNSDDSAIKALLELETESETILSQDPHLSTLSEHLSNLKTLVQTLQRSRGRSLRSFLTRRVSTHSISRVAGSIESEIQAWIDRESTENLTKALQDPFNNEDELMKLLTQFEDRLLQGFNRELQDLVLRAKVFSSLETILCDSNCSKRIREQSAYAVAALIRFNKDVFVGQVLMGPTIHALLTVASTHSVKVLCALIKSIKSPLVDEIESNGEIPKIISFLDVKDLQMKMVAMDCILEIGYFGRKEAIEAMLEQGLVKKLVELQRSELGGDLIEIGRLNEEEEENVSVGGGVMETKRESRQRRFLESHPFASCVAKFAVQLEVGEGLRQREKRAFKQEILMRVREASVSDAEAATIVAEVLWGSSP
ncbi:hypothetical protein ACOSP7_008461 [Xanthoceras sorbifolium]|uniref:Armadillo-like helical n=1 Tax=Xanthoceras sorbifolium TaxID=99658 RepID=A0ABQ8ICJ0_9ROSI|nr:hypothetical protein JRO89_XS03G0287200 [Xanthoceras sorbifolium]